MRYGLVLLILWTLFLLGVLFLPIPSRVTPSIEGFRYMDKVAHFGLFGITGVVGVFGASFLRRFKTRMLFVIVLGIFLAAATELVQSLIPYRSMDVYDFLADVLGLGIALAFLAILHRIHFFVRFLGP